eukprot:1198888-Rhodomonas_salina.1
MTARATPVYEHDGSTLACFIHSERQHGPAFGCRQPTPAPAHIVHIVHPSPPAPKPQPDLRSGTQPFQLNGALAAMGV